MRLIHASRYHAALVLIIMACGRLPVAAIAQEAMQKRMEELVQQLGDDSYRVRENAVEELLRSGLQTKTALFAGMKSREFEIAARCRRLWCEVRIDIGWQHVREVIGDSPKSRDLFDAMFLADPILWYELAETPRPSNVVFTERREQLQELLKEGEAQSSKIEGVLANLFYFGVQAKRADPRQDLPSLDSLLSAGPCQQSLREALKFENALCSLWDLWAKAVGADGPAFERLLVALRENRSQAVGLASEMLCDGRATAKQKQYCLLALAKHIRPEDATLVADALNDSSVLDVMVVKGVSVKSQLRDVALAVEIHRAGQDPRDFDFKYLRQDNRMLFSPASLGFKDDTERRQAFDKWHAWLAQKAGATAPGT